MSQSMQQPAAGGHGLLCPNCQVQLVMSDRQGIEIDYCPQCRGVWLDRGELDKIIERSLPASSSPAAETTRQRTDDRHGHGSSHGRHDERYGGQGRRRESFLSRLFDD
jgi:Zn-finger nucleic acid-binding protein